MAWDRKNFDYLRDAFQTLQGLHARWAEDISSFRRRVRAPFDNATPMERRRYELKHFKWLSTEMNCWRSLLPAIRRFAKRKDPKSILRVQKLLRSIADLQREVEKLGETANAVFDAQVMEYFQYHPPR